LPVGVEATAANGNLTLAGIVRDTTEGAATELRVAGLAGVRSVQNDIQIRDDTGPADVTPHVQDLPF